MFRRSLLATCVGFTAYAYFNSHTHEAEDNSRRRVGYFEAGGIVFKDKIEVMAVGDPKIDGVTCYISTGERALNPFTDPSNASICCTQTGPIRFRARIDLSQNGEDVFSTSKNLLFKELKVRRIYDHATNTLVYVSYNSRLLTDNKNPGSRFQSSIDCIPLKDERPPY
jgi:catabolite regulation protein CreA